MNVWHVGRKKTRKAEVVINHSNNALLESGAQTLLNYTDKGGDANLMSTLNLNFRDLRCDCKRVQISQDILIKFNSISCSIIVGQKRGK